MKRARIISPVLLSVSVPQLNKFAFHVLRPVDWIWLDWVWVLWTGFKWCQASSAWAWHYFNGWLVHCSLECVPKVTAHMNEMSVHHSGFNEPHCKALNSSKNSFSENLIKVNTSVYNSKRNEYVAPYLSRTHWIERSWNVRIFYSIGSNSSWSKHHLNDWVGQLGKHNFNLPLIEKWRKRNYRSK